MNKPTESTMFDVRDTVMKGILRGIIDPKIGMEIVMATLGLTPNERRTIRKANMIKRKGRS